MSKQKTEPYDVFAQAESFAASAKLLVDEIYSAKNPAYGVPSIVNRAFAIELYLKCLLLLDGKQPWGHELTQLFGNLLPSTQENVKILYYSILPQHQWVIDMMERQMALDGITTPIPIDFESALLEADNSFVRFRYLFEPREDAAKSNITMLAIEQATRAYIVACRADWDTGHPALLKSFVLVPNADKTNVIGLENMPKDSKQFIVSSNCLNGSCRQQIALVVDMEPGLAFPIERTKGLPLVPYPKWGDVQCSQCYSNTCHSHIQKAIESYTGRAVYFA